MQRSKSTEGCSPAISVQHYTGSTGERVSRCFTVSYTDVFFVHPQIFFSSQFIRVTSSVSMQFCIMMTEMLPGEYEVAHRSM